MQPLYLTGDEVFFLGGKNKIAIEKTARGITLPHPNPPI
jgi:hypothetical protein